jgi:hypothetical protein
MLHAFETALEKLFRFALIIFPSVTIGENPLGIARYYVTFKIS